MASYHPIRTDKEITDNNEIVRILKTGKYVIISFAKNDEPYIVTLSYGYDANNNKLYFHCAWKGQKIDFITENPNVCATIIEDKGYIKDKCDHDYSSLIIRGKLRIVNTIDEKKLGLEILLNHLEENPNPIKERNISNDDSYKKVCILCLDVVDISAKHH
jgi:uncharacterized protein